jgi:hypothetical protein
MSLDEILSLSISRRKRILYFVAKEKKNFYDFLKNLFGAK